MVRNRNIRSFRGLLALYFTCQLFTKGLTNYISPFSMSEIGFLDDFQDKVLGLESMYCGSLCEFRFPLEAMYNFNCADCRCDPLCLSYEDCCPDIQLRHDETLPHLDTQCVSASVKAGNTSFLMIVSCASDWLEDDIIENCTATCNGTNVDCYLPVTDKITNITYRNKFCAECNRIDTFQEWAAYAECEVNDPVFHQAKTAEEIFSHVVESDNCDATFKLLHDPVAFVRPCPISPINATSECNVTGQWEHYDADIEMACSMYTRVNRKTYKNMFCRLCNGDTWSDLAQEDGPFVAPQGTVAGVPLTALLQFGNPREESSMASTYVKKQNIITCLPNEVYDNHSCQCLRILCDEGKYLSQNICKSYIQETNYIGYDVCLHIKSILQAPPVEFLIPFDLSWHLMDINWALKDMLPYNVIVAKSMSQFTNIQLCEDNLITEIHSSFSLISPNVHDADELQLYLMTATEFMKEELEITLNVTVAIRDSCVSENMIETETLFSFPDVDLTIGVPLYYVNELKTLISNAKYVPLNKFLTCSHVALNKDQFIARDEKEPTLHKYASNITCQDYTRATTETEMVFTATGTVLEHSQYFLSQNVVKICVDDYEKLVANLTNQCQVSGGILYTGKTKSSQNSNALTTNTLGILSLVCTCVSLLFLVITFLTYCVLSELRTTGGICNMGLTATLFIAQILYEFGVEQYEDVLTCKIIGILIHFFWLAAVLWTNACVIQFFYRLTFPLRSRTMTTSTRGIFLVSAAYSYGMSLLVVIVTILSHYFTSGEIGYGGDICYLNTFYGLVFAFSIPVGVITIANIIMFIVTIVRLNCRKISTTSSKSSKVGIFACVKLSTLTGVSWLFGYIYRMTSVETFAYVFTVLVGLQGLLLFFALIVNSHVLHLFKTKFKLYSTEGHGTISQDATCSSTHSLNTSAHSTHSLDTTVYSIHSSHNTAHCTRSSDATTSTH